MHKRSDNVSDAWSVDVVFFQFFLRVVEDVSAMNYRDKRRLQQSPGSTPYPTHALVRWEAVTLRNFKFGSFEEQGPGKLTMTSLFMIGLTSLRYPIYS
jgi:hypothetical protein